MGLRNMKWRIAVCVLISFSILGYVLHDANRKLNEMRQMSDKCHQQQESLSAQLQVIYEHKNRLEKSLQLEKQQHKKTKAELHSQFEEFKEKEKQEFTNRFNSLQQQHKMLQIQMEDAQEELHKVQESNLLYNREKEQFVNKQQKLEQTGQQKDREINSLKVQILHSRNVMSSLNDRLLGMSHELEETKKKLGSCQKSTETKQLPQPTIGEVKVIGNQLNDKTIGSDKTTEKKIDESKNEVIAAPFVAEKVDEKFEKTGENVDESKIQLEPPQGGDLEVPIEAKKIAEREAEIQNLRPNIGREEEFQGNGLEQQENGDQDLDNMEDEGEANHHNKEENKPFEEADFDQIVEDPKPLAPKEVAAVGH